MFGKWVNCAALYRTRPSRDHAVGMIDIRLEYTDGLRLYDPRLFSAIALALLNFVNLIASCG